MICIGADGQPTDWFIKCRYIEFQLLIIEFQLPITKYQLLIFDVIDVLTRTDCIIQFVFQQTFHIVVLNEAPKVMSFWCALVRIPGTYVISSFQKVPYGTLLHA